MKSLINYLALTVFIGVLLVAPRGCYSYEGKVGTEETGRSVYRVEVDLSALSSLQEKGKIYEFGKQHLKRQDYIFWTNYQMDIEVDLSGSNESELPFVVTFLFPGYIIESNAMKVEKAKATWLVDGDREVKISLRGRLIRWVYIFLFLSSLTALSICYLRGKSA